jgi:hypothetical protein
MSYQSAAALRSEYTTWLRTYNFHLAITINANTLLPTINDQMKLIEAVDGKLNRKFLGNRYTALPEHSRIGLVAVSEHKLCADHFHFAIRFPSALRASVRDEAAAERVRKILSTFLKSPRFGRTYLPAASIDVRACHDSAGWIDYILKNVTETVPVYVRGLPNVAAAA